MRKLRCPSGVRFSPMNKLQGQTHIKNGSKPWSQLRCPCETRFLVVLRAIPGFQAHFQIDQQPPVHLYLQLQTQQLSKPLDTNGWTTVEKKRKSGGPRHKFTEPSVRAPAKMDPIPVPNTVEEEERHFQEAVRLSTKLTGAMGPNNTAVLDLASFPPLSSASSPDPSMLARFREGMRRIGPPTSTPVADPRADPAPSSEPHLHSSRNANSSLPIVNLPGADPTLSPEPRAPDLHSSQNLNNSWPIVGLRRADQTPSPHQIFAHHKI